MNSSFNDRPPLDLEMLRGRTRDRSTVAAQNGMVCTSQPLASIAGLEILKSGGNCVDAAIAANAVLGVTEPAMCGIGGDLFAILWLEREQKLVGLNASGRAPYEWNLTKAEGLGVRSIEQRSVLSWTVPGCVDGWQQLSDRHGELALSACLDAAIGYAEDGFPVSPIISTHFDWPDERLPHMAHVYHPSGNVPRFGDVFRNPELAWSYQQIAAGGSEAFYLGEIGVQMVSKSQELGGHMTLRDLEDHRSEWVDPVAVNYRGWDLWELPPNGQGLAALQMMNLLEQFDLSSMTPNSAEHLHLLVEAKKLAFEDRAKFYADPDFANVPMDWLISKDYAKERAARIDLSRAAVDVGHGDPDLGSDTVYLAAADAEGNMVSFIQSIYKGFGSCICPDRVGFPVQNRGQGFSLDPEHANRLEPHKRPFHTIIPGFLTQEGQPVCSFGVMGGDFQPQGHAQVLMNMLDFGMSPQQAGDQPRVEHRGSTDPWGGSMTAGGELVLEVGVSDEVRGQLSGMGHRISKETDAHGGYQAIWRRSNPRIYFGASDPRKDGLAVGW